MNLQYPWRLALLALFCLTTLLACGKDPAAAPPSSAAPTAGPPTDTDKTIELYMVYGSEKRAWVNDVTAAFNATHAKTASGKIIHVTAEAEGSGETMDDVLSGRKHADIVSPASGAFVTLANADSRASTGADLVGATQSVVLSPVVIAMWKPMAEALGYPNKPIGWSDVLALAQNPNGWADVGKPQFGPFRFAHTHPEFSNSGLISVLAEVYAATGKQNGLTTEDVQKPQTAAYVTGIEHAVVHYGSSTGFFADKMFAGGPGYVSAAVLYESNVIESYSTKPPTDLPVVAIYPKEGTFWSDHPVGIVQRDWVTAEHKEAAKAYIAYLMAVPQQQKALTYGFRPANTDVPLGAPIDAAHGVNPRGMQTALEVPSADVMHSILSMWKENKKHAHIALVIDHSGSMQDNSKMTNARAAAAQMIQMLHDQDHLSLMAFSTNSEWLIQNAPMKTQRTQAETLASGLIADGNTRLYNSINDAYAYLAAQNDDSHILAVVLLTDGEDTANQMTVDQLLPRIRYNAEKRNIRVFTVAYGADANKKILSQIADETKAKSFVGTPENIREVFKEIATFF